MEISQEVLRTFTPFDSLHEEYLSRVQSKATIRTFAKGAMIFKRGKHLQESFYLVKGEVDLINAAFEVKSLHQDTEASRYPVVESTPTQVSAIAKSPVELLAVERDFLDLVMAWSQSSDVSETDAQDNPKAAEAEEEDWMSCLLQSPLFTKVPPANIQQLFARFGSIEVAAGEKIVREGEPGDYFYVIERGSVEVLTKSGKLQATLKAGQYFGEEALIGDTTRNATVVMASDGVLMRLEKEAFKTLLQVPVLRYIGFDELSFGEAENVTLDGKPCQLLDVRLPIEHRHTRVACSLNAPLASLRNRLGTFSPDSVYIVTDDAGRRSEVAAHLLCQAGFDALILKNAAGHQQTG